MISNTAVPKYYGRFREAVRNGEIAINREIEMQMNRIDARIRNPRYYYDDKAIDGFIAYVEDELTLTDGSNVKMLDTFKLWAEDLYAWFYYEDRSVHIDDPSGHGGRWEKRRFKKRLTNKQYLIIARGAAKSMYESFIQSYELNMNTTTTKQITTAPTMRQAEEILSPIRTSIIRSKGPLFKFLTHGSINNNNGSKAERVHLAATKKGIENFITGSKIEVLPMSVDKLQGYRPYLSTVDEWLSGDVREDVIGAIEQGASKLDDYIIIATSSEGTVRNGPGDTIKMELMKILKGEYQADHVSIFWYKLDDIHEVADWHMWEKANPNIGKTISYDVYKKDVDKAEAVPAARNDILAKRFGLPMEGYTYFFTYGEILPHERRDFWGLPCAMGGDMSQGDDFCAFDFLFPLGGYEFGLKCRSYITERTLCLLPSSLRQKYEEFINEGSLIVMEGAVLDMMQVYDDLDRYIQDSQYDVLAFGFDPYNAKEFVARWEQENGPMGIEKVIQGAKTESVPLGELKTLTEDRKIIFDQQLMSFCMGNAITMEDTNGNRKLMKRRREQKIDNVAAMLDAYIAWKANREMFE